MFMYNNMSEPQWREYAISDFLCPFFRYTQFNLTRFGVRLSRICRYLIFF